MKYLNIKKGSKLKSTTSFRENLDGENVIQTDLSASLTLTSDPGEFGLRLGRSVRGSMRLVSLGNGRYGISARPFRHDSECAQKQLSENIVSTQHGRLYRTKERTKLVFEFVHDISFDQLLDELDEEFWSIKNLLEMKKEGKC